jgi:MFS transporter, UMF1 family
MAEQTAKRRTVFSWAMFDFANSAFTTLVVTFIYSTYFTTEIAPSIEIGTHYWSMAIAASAVSIAILSPLLGTLADHSGHRKRYLFIATLLGIILTSTLYIPLRGQVVLALTLFVLANVTIEIAQVFYNAYLPEISNKANVGKISGYGWGLGYVGGLLCLGVALFLFVQPERPLFGLDKSTGQHIRATNLLVAAWFAVFSIPTFLILRDRKRTPSSQKQRVVRQSFQELGNTLRNLRQYRQIVRFLIARLFYNDALVTLIGFGGIYAVGTFGFSFEEILIFGIVLNIAAALGAVGFGFIDDKIGGKITIALSIIGFIIATVAVIITQSRAVFWAGGVLMGILIGPNQSASRSLFARFVPRSKETEFFGFFALSGKLTAFLGPLLLGILTRVFESQRVGFSVIIVQFLIGLALLLRVNEQEGLQSHEDNRGAVED